jgi:hypothetical protein
MPHVLVLTGMHRSGTSLLASVVRHAGIDIGASLMQGDRGNRRGHFEDLDFHGFHERFLERREVSPFVVPEGWEPDPTPAEIEQARELAARRSVKPLWGFKDPKTSLFLGVWDSVLAEPVHLFVYRHPVEVALSLLRRGLELEIQQDPRVAFRAWMAYNERLLAFRREHPGRCLLWHVAGATRSLEASAGALEERLGVALNRDGLGALFHRGELIGLQAAEIDWASLLPEAFDLYRRLEEAADLPGADLDGAQPAVGRSRQERDLLDVNEHLLAALLLASPGLPALPAASAGAAAPPGAAASPGAAALSTVERRRDYTYLRMLSAQYEEENCKLKERLREIEEERAAVESSTALRLVRTYWNAVRRARKLSVEIRRRLLADRTSL